LYLRGRKWADAVLVLTAALALAGLVGDFAVPSALNGSVTVRDGDAANMLESADAVMVEGDGLRQAQWQDLPARPLDWKAPQDAVLRLAFPRQLAFGRMFELMLQRGETTPARLQLRAENGQVLAEAGGTTAALTVRWLPPVAEAMVLEARLLDGAGKVLASGPVPLDVRAAEPLRVRGRFAAPSFDIRILNELLTGSNAVLDWQLTLGKSLTRSESAREAMPMPDLLVVDAAWVERLSEGARKTLLEEVGQGRPLLILGASAREPGFWSRTLQLELKAEADGVKLAGPLPLAAAPFNPVQGKGGAWSASADRVWTRNWRAGRITWLGVGDWHRYAISEPQALGVWWQGVLDQAGVRRDGGVRWQAAQDMPLPGERLALCALGAKENGVLQRRPDMADAACTAVWPQKAGWLELYGNKVYVFAPGDWPQWQRAQRRDATAAYAARTPVAALKGMAPLPAWPFGLLFAGAMLALWWRERR
jgi:hypothetical protein